MCGGDWRVQRRRQRSRVTIIGAMGRRPRAAQRPVADPPSPRSSQDAPLPWSLLLCGVGVVAIAVRLIHVATLSSTPLFDVLLGDSKRYVDWASAIAAGDWQG